MATPRGVELDEDEFVVFDRVLEVGLREDEDATLRLDLGSEGGGKRHRRQK